MPFPMFIPISGTYNFPANAEANLVQQGEVILQCNTTSVPCVINLPNILSFFAGSLWFKIKINDVNNNASVNTITINTSSGNYFMGVQTQYVINENGASAEVIMVNTNRWSVIKALSYDKQIIYNGTASGTNTYTSTVTGAVALYSGLKVSVIFSNANTGASSLNINSFGVVPIVKNGSSALASGDINAGQDLLLQYDGTNFQIIGGGGSSTDSDESEFSFVGVSRFLTNN